MTVSGRAPDVGRRAAYWIRDASGDLTPDIPPGVKMVAFRYARLAWAMVESGSTPADVLRMAANLRYGQTSPLRFPIRLTGLPRPWREVQQVEYLENSPQVWLSLLLGTHPDPRASSPADSLYLSVGVGKGFGDCGICHATVINGHKVYLATYPVSRYAPASDALFMPFADGLNLEIVVTGPDAPLSPAEVFAHHLQLLGRYPAQWTTRPIG
jgi:hypothetical protein